MTKQIFGFLLACACLAFVACGGNTTETGQAAEEETTEMTNEQAEADATAEADTAADEDKSGPEYTSAYVCPMHCEGSGSDEPGKCPVCGMDYVANEEAAKADDHGHSHDHDGHDHSH